MGFAKNQMGVGIPAQVADYDFMGQVATGLSAAGTTQGTATTIQADINMVSTVGASAGVLLFNGQISDSCVVFNDGGANPLAVYPPVGSKFNNLATNGAITLAANTALLCLKISATRWVAFLSA